MATSTELLRAAEHMRLRGEALIATGIVFKIAHGRANVQAADVLEREAARLQRIEAQQPKRSWPEGWPPFAVLRRAYKCTGMSHWPSTRACERSRERLRLDAAAEMRIRWSRALDLVCSQSSRPRP